MTNQLRLPDTHPPVAVTLQPVRRWVSVAMLALGLLALVIAVPVTQARLLQWKTIGSAGLSVVYEGRAEPGSTVRVNLPRRSPGPTLVVPASGRWSTEQRADEPASTIVADGKTLDARGLAVGHDVFPSEVLYLPLFGLLLILGRAVLPMIERFRHWRLLRARG